MRTHPTARQAATVQPGSTATLRRRGLTIVELIVVMTLIVIVLTLTVPGISSLVTDARRDETVQAINSALQRARNLAVQSRGYVAVRFVPGAWVLGEETDSTLDGRRQYLVLYQWQTATFDLEPELAPVMIERFERVAGTPPIALPSQFWVAPLEAVQIDQDDNLSDSILAGEIGAFEYSAVENDNDFLYADDFLIVFGPEGRVVPGPQVRNEQVAAFTEGQNGHVYRIWAYDPLEERETHRDPRGGDWLNAEPYERANFSSVVIYPREGFVNLGADASPGDRREHLARVGLPFAIHPRSAVLVDVELPRN